MAGMSQGSSYPEYGSANSLSLILGVSRSNPPVPDVPAVPSAVVDEWEAAVTAAVARVAQIEETTQQLNKASEQRGFSWALPVEPTEQARVPVWTSRSEWLRQFRYHTNSSAGKALCARRLIKPDKAYVVAEAHAHFAESRTGRGVTASKSTIAARAKVSESTVNRARRVLIDLGMGVEHVRGRKLRTIEFLAAEAHHGGQQRRAASTWALSSPRSIVESTPPTKSVKNRPSRAAERTSRYRNRNSRRCRFSAEYPPSQLPSATTVADTLSRGGLLSCQVLPLGRTHQSVSARTQPKIQKPSDGYDYPRPLQLQRAAAELVKHAPALAPPGHIGAVCDVLNRAGIDHTRWTGRDIALTLSHDTKERGWIWPTAASLTSPLAYLKYRISGIDWARESPSEQRKAADLATQKEQEQFERTQERRTRSAASPEHRAQALTDIRANLSAKLRLR